MKIALVIERFSLFRGGAERSTYELACSLSELGMDVTLLAGSIENRGLSNPVFRRREVAVTGITRSKRRRSFELSVRSHLADNNYDIVHSMAPLPSADVYQPRGGSTHHSIRRHIQSYNKPSRVLKRATSWLNHARRGCVDSERSLCRMRNGPVLAALSDYVARQFQDDYNLPGERVRIIRNGVGVAAIRGSKAVSDGRKLRQLYDRGGETALFLFAAENFRLKGLSWLLKAGRYAVRHRSGQLRDFRIMVVGGQGYQEYYKQSQKSGLDQRVVFMGPTRRMPALLQMCDAVILPTYNDACSRLVLESLAAGRPAVTTACNGAAEFLHNDSYGYVIDRCDDVTSLGQAMLKLCNINQQRKMSNAIEANKLHEQVSMTRHARELVELYKELRN